MPRSAWPAACAPTAVTLVQTPRVDPPRCLGCGVCVVTCPSGALELVPRAEEGTTAPALTKVDWRAERPQARGLTPGPEAEQQVGRGGLYLVEHMYYHGRVL